MSIVLDYPTETQQMKIIAAEHKLNELRVFIPDADDIDYTDDTMIVFSATKTTGFQSMMEFSRKVGSLFQRNVYVSTPNGIPDNTQMLKAQAYAEIV